MSRRPGLLVIGGSGELGQQVVKAATRWDVHATYFTEPRPISREAWHHLDIRDRRAVHQLVRRLRPHAIIHTAVSDRDRGKFRSDAEYKSAIVDGGRWMCQASVEVAARCVVLSTDLVFDGTQGNYTEEDPTSPIMAYGQAKADMEGALLAMAADVVVVRTSLILTLDPRGRHVRWIVEALRRGQSLDLFTDELRCPIWSDELAAALLELAVLDYRGLLHVAGPEVTHRYDLGLALAGFFGMDPSLLTPALSAKSGLNRPLDCTLDCRRAYDLLGTSITGVKARLESGDFQ